MTAVCGSIASGRITELARGQGRERAAVVARWVRHLLR
jgi:hypothetical protein